MMNEDIAGVTVLYNPDDNVLENIMSYVYHIKKLYVYDNSDIVNEDVIKKIKDIPNVYYLSEYANLGIARALNIGCQHAFEDGFKWILTMDQDSRIADSNFFNHFSENIDVSVGIYAASYTAFYDRRVSKYNKYFNNIHFVITSGNIVNIQAWLDVDKFEEKLFIDEVDHDFCVKVRLAGYKILTSVQLYLSHFVGIKQNLPNAKSIMLHTPLRNYYITRNALYIAKKYFFRDFPLVRNRLSNVFKNLVKVVLHYPNKLHYLQMILLGTKDFLLGNYGKYNNKL